MKLSPDQVQAVDNVLAWWKARESDQFVLTGYAGTGKTTIIKNVVRQIPSIVGAPTGKAAFRLREKTGADAATIHRLAYEFQGEDAKGRLQFEFKGLFEGGKLLIIDESSMLDAQVYQDLMSQGYRILFVGDPGQLPPIGESPGILDVPDFSLTEIHRQENGPLLDFCHALRQGHYLPKSNNDVWLWPRWDEAGVKEILAQVDVVLCYKNATRRRLNLEMMKLRGLVEYGETAADLWPQLRGKTFKIVGLRNYPKLDLYNGTEADFRLEEVTEFGLFGSLMDIGGTGTEVMLSKAGFLTEAVPSEDRQRRDRLLADFGYCLTAHKSQGSEWENVAVYDDTGGTIQHQARWNYTAATRAKSRLVWVHNGPGTTGPKKMIEPA